VKTKHLLAFAGLLILCFMMLNCSSGGGSNSWDIPNAPLSNRESYPLPITGSESYVMPVSVGGANASLTNSPVVTVTVCDTTLTYCDTIDNVLVDTGSFGFRVFQSLLTNTSGHLTPVSPHDKAGSLAECFAYAGGTSDWGPVYTARLKLGGETTNAVSIQLINASYSGIPDSCEGPDESPSTAGFNGILGVGGFVADCTGQFCDPTGSDNNGIYFSCTGSTCTGAEVATASQVSNPVAFLPTDNNGVALQLPAIDQNGAVSVSGYLVMGIATETDNTPTPSQVVVYPVDPQYYKFNTQFSGASMSAFIDSGSSIFFFPTNNYVGACGTDDTNYGLFCPNTIVTLSAEMIGTNNTPSETIQFNVLNPDYAFSSDNPNYVFNDIAGVSNQNLIDSDSSDFDWGLPFFFGRTIYVGFDFKGSNLSPNTTEFSGTQNNIYWAF
jgi:hypothetical protein